MATWNELFLSDEHIKAFPETAVMNFLVYLNKTFSEKPLWVWDLCCGGGRHTVAAASLGFRIYASDNAENGIQHTKQWLAQTGLSATCQVADMTQCPWPDQRFHGIICWDAINHNVLSAIRHTINMIQEHLVPGGFFLATLKSTKADGYGNGKEIEPQTFVPETGCEAGVPHHYFDEEGIHTLFAKWEILILTEQLMTYKERGHESVKFNPFPYTTWGILARRNK